MGHAFQGCDTLLDEKQSGCPSLVTDVLAHTIEEKKITVSLQLETNIMITNSRILTEQH